MEERKSMGSALVDVFDAGVTLVKSEINSVGRKVGEVAKAKGLGAVILLAAVGPLIMGLIFLILTVFYGLMALGLPAWAAALIIALVSLALTGALVMMGLKKLSAEVPTNEPLAYRDPATYTEDERLEAEYQAKQRAERERAAVTTAPVTTAPVTTGAVGTPVSTTTTVYPAAAPVTASTTTYVVTPETGVRGDVTPTSVHTTGAYSSGASQPSGTATLRVEEGATTVPVYESRSTGEAQEYGSGLNRKIEAQEHPGARHAPAHDPNIQHPVVLKDEPGITVSTTPTFRDDMKKEGYNG